ncbi:hypothetical protein AAF712_015619 [Marasmius tenuissimus]|uniref:SH3 domain-containing protein n=1 Tax=Marasmius tenuissimus TaxID=585030 RepID=A0ABR2Z8Z8_9AGAR
MSTSESTRINSGSAILDQAQLLDISNGDNASVAGLEGPNPILVNTAAAPSNDESIESAPPPGPIVSCSADTHPAQAASNSGQGGSGSNTISGIICPTGHNVVDLPAPNNRWYTIFVGKKVGWIRGHACALELTRNVSGQGLCYSPVGEQGAHAYYHEKQQAGEVRVVDDGVAVNMTYGVEEGALFP